MLRPASLALAAAIALAAPSAAFAAPERPVAAHVQEAPAPAAKSETVDYAQRESKDSKVADYQGGSRVVIGISGGALLILIIVLILVL
ncbi:MAG: hypothetical protein WKG01_16190 [Kofleriaceae bacterium]